MEAARINLGVEIPKEVASDKGLASSSKGLSKTKPRGSLKQITLEGVVRYIESTKFSSQKKEELIKKAKNCPTGALAHFCRNIK